MKIEKLKTGMILKNYKELCSYLDIPEKIGKARMMQLKELERYLRYHKIGNKIIIDEVFEMAMEKIDKRKDSKKISNNGLYSNDIQTLIIDMLAQNKDNHVCLPISAILKKLEMISINYREGRNNILKLSEISNVPQNYCYEFYTNTNVRLREKLETALKGLRRRALVVWCESIAVCVRVTQDVRFNELEDIVLDKDNSTITIDTVHRQASRQEKKLIIKAEREILSKYNASSTYDVFIQGRFKDFQKEVNAVILERANIEYYYTCYDIIYNHDDIEDEKKLQKLRKKERLSIQDNLNKNIVNLVNDGAQTLNVRKSLKQDRTEYDNMLASSMYLEHTKTLSDILINKDAKDIRKQLKKDVKQKNPNIKQIDFGELPF